MTSDPVERLFVWIWLPGSEEPVVAGALEPFGEGVVFTYGRSYLARQGRISIYEPELPLGAGLLRPKVGLTVPGCILDAAPDSWGKRVIMHRLLGSDAANADPGDLGVFTYLLQSGSNRTGAIDFQQSSSEYVPRNEASTPLEELLRAAEGLQEGLDFEPDLEEALMHGSSIGGARPKATIEDDGRSLIAKFSSNSDTIPVVKGEYAAMDLARRAGISVAPVQIERVLGRDVLLVERFDRVRGGRERRAIVSALTILELDEMIGHHATYVEFAQRIRESFTDARSALKELFGRITFNILVGNTDDHARNHAAFWDGQALSLAPAYDICPQLRSGETAAQAMAFGPDGARVSQLGRCVAASSSYLLSEADAREIIDNQHSVIEDQWSDVADAAGMTAAERKQFWRRQFLNPYAFYDY